MAQCFLETDWFLHNAHLQQADDQEMQGVIESDAFDQCGEEPGPCLHHPFVV